MKKLKFSNKPIITKVKDVNRVVIEVFFPINTNIKDTVKKSLLMRCMSSYNNNYRDPKTFLEAQDSLYIINFGSKALTYNEISYLKFSMIIPKEGIIDEFDLDKALRFFYDSIYNPYIDKDKFNEEIFKSERDFLLEREKTFPRDIYDYVYDEYYKFIDKDETYGLSHEHYIEDLNKITAKELYKFYKDSIIDNKYFVYISGSIKDKKHIEDSFNKIFNNKKYTNYVINSNFCRFEKDYDYKHKEEITKYNQSVLFMHYVIKDLKEKELAYFSTLFYILNSKENALIYNALRTDNSIVYSSKMKDKKRYGYFDIVVYFNDRPYEEIMTIVNRTIHSLYDEKFFKECKDRLVKSLGYDLLIEEDEPFAKVFEMIETSISNSMTFEKKLKLIKDIDYDSFISFIERLTLTKTYLFKGGDKNVKG